MSDINVKEITVDGYTQFVATLKLVCGTVIRMAGSSPEEAITNAEEEARYIYLMLLLSTPIKV